MIGFPDMSTDLIVRDNCVLAVVADAVLDGELVPTTLIAETWYM